MRISSASKTILLVEDSKFQKLVGERLLAKAGYTVFAVADGEEAIHKAQEQIPDLILLDLLLPKVGGLEVLQRLKANPKTAAIPVIVLSGLPKTNHEKLRAEGIEDYFEKSRFFEGTEGESQLLALVKQTLQSHRKTAGAVSAVVGG
jgi:CheY-like chemotaxis protein